MTELPKGWVASTLGEATEIASGIGFPLEFQGKTDGDIPFFKVGDISRAVKENDGELRVAEHYVSREVAEKLRGTPIRAGATFFAKIGEAIKLNRRAYSKGQCLVDNNVMAVAPIVEGSDRYLFMFLKTQDFSDLSRATTVPSLRKGDIEGIAFPLPPLPEQRRIVAKLDALFERSRKAKESLGRIPAMLERLRQSILAAAFRGDLTKDWREAHLGVEPIEQAIGRVRHGVSRTGGRQATETMIRGRYGLAVGDPGLDSPRGWKWVPLSAVARMESGHTPSREHEDYWNGGIPWIGIKDAREWHGRRIESTEQTVTDKGLANSSSRLLPKNTVCLSRTASVGYVTIMDREMATSQDFANWVCSDALVPEFLMFLLVAEHDSLFDFGKGTTHTTIYFPELKAFHICLPPVPEQREIVRRIERRFAATKSISASVAAATEKMGDIEPSFLTKAFRGELVPQDPNDEPASVLLERIRAERAGAEKASPRARRTRA